MRISRLLTTPLLLGLAVQGSFAAKHNPSIAQTAASIEDKLYHAKIFQHGQVQVKFDEGVATLSGTVDSLGVKMDAERAARKVDDVVRVVNNIRVQAEEVSPREIAGQARKEIVSSGDRIGSCTWPVRNPFPISFIESPIGMVTMTWTGSGRMGPRTIIFGLRVKIVAKTYSPSPFNCSGVLSSNHNLQIFFQPIRRHFLNTVFNSFKSFASRRSFLADFKSSRDAIAVMSTSGGDR